MATHAFTFSPATLKREQLEHMTNAWSEMLSEARKSLFGQQWQPAVTQYWRAYGMAEQLLKESLCKNCAIKGYIRTLVELAYVLRKNQQEEKLSAIAELAKPTWDVQLTVALSQELIAIITNIAYAPIVQIDVWIDGLFAMDVAATQPLH